MSIKRWVEIILDLIGKLRLNRAGSVTLPAPKSYHEYGYSSDHYIRVADQPKKAIQVPPEEGAHPDTCYDPCGRTKKIKQEKSSPRHVEGTR